MNIFVVSSDPVECAICLDDKRLIKMIVESAQMLSTAVARYGVKAPYRATHINHPCTLWSGDSKANYEWHIALLKSMGDEYTRRFSKDHKSIVDCFASLKEKASFIPEGKLTPFKNCSMFKDIEEVHEAYRVTLIEKWKRDKRPPKWTNASKPTWFFT